MRPGYGLAALALLSLTLVSPPAAAVTSGGMSDATPPPDGAQSAYDAGVAAFERGDWAAVIAQMAKVIAERPWDADAHNLAGFAHRKLGDYERALAFYDKALELNPHHRGALEYLGEAYLELDRPDDALALLERLGTECRRIADGDDWRAECEEWQDLKAAFDAYTAGRRQAGLDE